MQSLSDFRPLHVKQELAHQGIHCTAIERFTSNGDKDRDKHRNRRKTVERELESWREREREGEMNKQTHHRYTAKSFNFPDLNENMSLTPRIHLLAKMFAKCANLVITPVSQCVFYQTYVGM